MTIALLWKWGRITRVNAPRYALQLSYKRNRQTVQRSYSVMVLSITRISIKALSNS